jgi:hypothetical protein
MPEGGDTGSCAARVVVVAQERFQSVRVWSLLVLDVCGIWMGMHRSPTSRLVSHPYFSAVSMMPGASTSTGFHLALSRVRAPPSVAHRRPLARSVSLSQLLLNLFRVRHRASRQLCRPCRIFVTTPRAISHHDRGR